MKSSAVSAGQNALATQYNNLRSDAMIYFDHNATTPLGELVNAGATLQLAGLPAHTRLTVSFNLFIL